MDQTSWTYCKKKVLERGSRKEAVSKRTLKREVSVSNWLGKKDDPESKVMAMISMKEGVSKII